MKRTYTITISSAFVAPDLCWRWEVECCHRIDGEVHSRDNIGSGLAATLHVASVVATDAAHKAEFAFHDGEDPT